MKPADKGENLVVLDHVSYKRMVLDILVDARYYDRLPNDPTDHTESLLMKALDERLISKNECSFMVPRNPQVTSFYKLPKVHKGLSPNKG